jgi:hypothetical protein
MVLAGVAMSGALAAPAAAHGNDNDGDGHRGTNKVVDVSRRVVTWTMTSASCSQLPANTTITGTGVLRVKITTFTASNGVITEVWDERADGRAVDQDGKRYHWNYKNDSIETNSVASPQLFTGPMTDTFELEGKGPIEVEAGFEANVVDDRVAGTFVINPVTQYGDPLDFDADPFLNRCDPL